MDTYKEKYEKALERAKKYHEGHTLDVNPQSAMEYVFPELKESEDEKIRKALLHTLQNRKEYCISDTFGEVNVEDAISWLEKQGDYNRLVEEMKKRKELLSKEKKKATSSNDKLSLGGRITILEELLTFTNTIKNNVTSCLKR